MQKYAKRDSIVHAVRWDGENADAVSALAGPTVRVRPDQTLVVPLYGSCVNVLSGPERTFLYIPLGSWLVLSECGKSLQQMTDVEFHAEFLSTKDMDGGVDFVELPRQPPPPIKWLRESPKEGLDYRVVCRNGGYFPEKKQRHWLWGEWWERIGIGVHPSVDSARTEIRRKLLIEQKNGVVWSGTCEEVVSSGFEPELSPSVSPPPPPPQRGG